MMPENTIKQRFDDERQRKDCFLCCAAMASGRSYDDAWALLDDGLRACLSPDAKGPKGTECDAVLERIGFSKGDYRLLFMLPEYATTGFLRNMLWGRRALIQVPSKNYRGEHHIVYWDGTELHDPSNMHAWKWEEVEPVYIWIFDERRAEVNK